MSFLLPHHVPPSVRLTREVATLLAAPIIIPAATGPVCFLSGRPEPTEWKGDEEESGDDDENEVDLYVAMGTKSVGTSSPPVPSLFPGSLEGVQTTAPTAPFSNEEKIDSWMQRCLDSLPGPRSTIHPVVDVATWEDCIQSVAARSEVTQFQQLGHQSVCRHRWIHDWMLHRPLQASCGFLRDTHDVLWMLYRTSTAQWSLWNPSASSSPDWVLRLLTTLNASGHAAEHVRWPVTLQSLTKEDTRRTFLFAFYLHIMGQGWLDWVDGKLVSVQSVSLASQPTLKCVHVYHPTTKLTPDQISTFNQTKINSFVEGCGRPGGAS